MSGMGDAERYLAQILSVLIDKAGGTIALSDRDVQRIAYVKPEIQILTVDGFSNDAIRIRYRENVTVEGEVAE